MDEGWTRCPLPLPRILDFGPPNHKLTRQRGPELSSDRYVLLSAVNDKSS